MKQQPLIAYFESLSRLVETGSSYCAFLERIGSQKQRILFPNQCLITCPYQELIDIASKYNLPSSQEEMVTLLLGRPLQNPIEFFRTRIIALAVISGFGNVRVELQDSRSFIGTVEISYRGHRTKV